MRRAILSLAEASAVLVEFAHLLTEATGVSRAGRCRLVGFRLLPCFQVDIFSLVLLVLFDFSIPGPVRLFRVWPIRRLPGIVSWCFARIFFVRCLAHAHICSLMASVRIEELPPELVVPGSASQGQTAQDT